MMRSGRKVTDIYISVKCASTGWERNNAKDYKYAYKCLSDYV